MRISNIYDKQLQAIEEAEMKVRIAKRNLKEAERELDETLALVETELTEARTGRTFHFVVNNGSGNWIVATEDKFGVSKDKNPIDFDDYVQDIMYKGDPEKADVLEKLISMVKKHKGWKLGVWTGNDLQRLFGVIDLSDKSLRTEDGRVYKFNKKGKVEKTEKGKTEVIKKGK